MKLRAMVLIAVLLIMLLSACTINRPISATSNPLGEKVGVYSQTGILGFPPMANNDAAVARAAANGGITKISTVDYNVTWMIFIMKYDTIVTGN